MCTYISIHTHTYIYIHTHTDLVVEAYVLEVLGIDGKEAAGHGRGGNRVCGLAARQVRRVDPLEGQRPIQRPSHERRLNVLCGSGSEIISKTINERSMYNAII